MSTLFAKAKAWLPAQLQVAAGVSITMTRDGEEHDLTAVIGNTIYAVNRPDGGARVEFGQRDFLILAADMVAANADWTEPKVGDRFTVEDESADVCWECMVPETGEPDWRWSDPQHTTFRIHTKEKELS